MKPERFIRILPVSLLLTLSLGAGLSLYSGYQASLGLLIGGLWSTANLWEIFHLLREIFVQKRRLYILVMAQIKVPLLYGTGYLALTYIPVDVMWAVVGFHIPIVYILIDSLRYSKDNHIQKLE